MAITQAHVSLDSIGKFLDLIDRLRKPSPGDATNAFLQAIQATQAQSGMAGGANSQPGQRVGPTNEAAANAQQAQAAAPDSNRVRALYETLLSNPQLAADLPADTLSTMLTSAQGLQAMEPKPSDASQKLQELKGLGIQIDPALIERAYGVAAPTNEPPSDLQIIDRINAERTAAGKPQMSAEEGMSFLANLRKAAGDTTIISPTFDTSALGDVLAQFINKDQVASREDRLSQLEPTLKQLARAKAVLETPGVTRWLVSNPLGRTLGSGAATLQSMGLLRQFKDLNSKDFGEAQAALESGIGFAASQIARLFETDISEPTQKRLMAIASTSNWLSNPDQALGAINELNSIIEGLQSQTKKELKQGGVTVEPGPNQPQPSLPADRQKFNDAVRAKADQLLKSNSKKYPGGLKDPQLLLDAVQAVSRERAVTIPVPKVD